MFDLMRACSIRLLALLFVAAAVCPAHARAVKDDAAAGRAGAAIQAPPAAAAPESAPADAAATPPAASAAEPAGGEPGLPTQSYSLQLAQLAAGTEFKLFGIRNRQQLEFTLRRDRQVTRATLNLVFTPSPALLPKISHLRVYLNDELMGVIPVDESAPGRQQRRSLELDPAFLASFNRLNLEFVGHYTDICEDLSHSSLWLDISRQTTLVIEQQYLPLANELSYFPEPFLDKHDMTAQTLPFVFAEPPSTARLQAASVLASYFGAQARWRQLRLPVLYNQLPEGHAIVFAANGDRPAFLDGYPEVDGPTVDMISAPDRPYQKLLLVLGRDDKDLQTAAAALALGGPLFRGQSVQVEEVDELAPRKPYDAPNWIATDRPVRFSELVEYEGQLEVQGLRPAPITLNLNLPPDLFVWRNNGIPMNVQYRYTPPTTEDESRLTLSLNGRYVDSYPLRPETDKSGLPHVRLPVLDNDPGASSEGLLIPALKIGSHNQIQFDFSYASVLGAAQPGVCKTVLPVDTRAALDGHSTIDFSGYRHYLEMPNLRAFASSGFPFSRMADLSETLVVVPPQLRPVQVSTLLEALAHIGAQVGYPAYKVRIVDDWAQAAGLDADLLWIGSAPEAFRGRPDANLLLEDTKTRLRQARKPEDDTAQSPRTVYSRWPDGDTVTQVSVRALAPIAAIVGMQSEQFPQRSMVGLLAATDEDYSLLRDALADSGKRDAMRGSVVIVRESGVASEAVGPRYFVGRLEWWQMVWFHLSDKPLLLALIAIFAVALVAFLLWKSLRWVARRRLARDA